MQIFISWLNLEINSTLISTLHNALCTCSPSVCNIAVEMNLGYISITSAPIVSWNTIVIIHLVCSLISRWHHMYCIDHMFLPVQLWQYIIFIVIHCSWPGITSLLTYSLFRVIHWHYEQWVTQQQHNIYIYILLSLIRFFLFLILAVHVNHQGTSPYFRNSKNWWFSWSCL